MTRGTAEARRIERRCAFPHPREHLVFAFGKPIDVVHQIYEQEFAAERP
jgi:hypothetical protein